MAVPEGFFSEKLIRFQFSNRILPYLPIRTFAYCTTLHDRTYLFSKSFGGYHTVFETHAAWFAHSHFRMLPFTSTHLYATQLSTPMSIRYHVTLSQSYLASITTTSSHTYLLFNKI